MRRDAKRTARGEKTSTARPRPVPWIGELEPAVHGSWEGASQPILDFSANGNVIGPPPGVREAITGAAIDRYPERTSVSLRRVIADRHGLDPEMVVVGNGSTELIWATARAFLAPGSLSLVLGPSYGEYATASRAAGAEVREVWGGFTLGGQFLRAQPFRPVGEGLVPSRPASSTRGSAAGDKPPPYRNDGSDVIAISMRNDPAAGNGQSSQDLMLSVISDLQPGVVWLCHPNNPTGSAFPIEVLPELIEVAPRTLFVADEAYWTLTKGLASAVPYVAGGHVVVLRSLTKDLGLAGLRVGYALAAEQVADAIQRALPPWNVSSVAQAAARAALDDAAHLEEARAEVAASRDHLERGLRRLGLEPNPSAANFVLVRVGDAAAVTTGLLGRGCAVRDCTSFGLREHIRIGVRSLADQEVLLTALAQVLGRSSGSARACPPPQGSQGRPLGGRGQASPLPDEGPRANKATFGYG